MNTAISPRFLLLLVSCCLLVSCHRNINIDNLCGRYTSDYAEATEELHLNPDFTFYQRVTLKTSGRVDVAKGNWRYNNDSGYILFSDKFMVVLDGYRQLDKHYYDRSPGKVALPVAKWFGRITIGAAEGIVYNKQ